MHVYYCVLLATQGSMLCAVQIPGLAKCQLLLYSHPTDIATIYLLYIIGRIGQSLRWSKQTDLQKLIQQSCCSLPQPHRKKKYVLQYHYILYMQQDAKTEAQYTHKTNKNKTTIPPNQTIPKQLYQPHSPYQTLLQHYTPCIA